MFAPFPNTLRAIDSESARPHVVTILSIAALSIAMAFWVRCGAIGIYVASSSARFEADQVAHAVEPSVNGVVQISELQLGREVAAGDVLVVLDSTAEQLQQKQELARRESTAQLVAGYDREIFAAQRALERYEQSREAAGRVAEAKRARATVVAEATDEQNAVVQNLRAHQLTSGLDALRSNGTARQQHADALLAEVELQESSASTASTESDRLVQLARLERERSVLVGQLQNSDAALTGLQFEIDRRTLRAPIAGRIADVLPTTHGTTVTAGADLATIVPTGNLRLVAQFSPGDAVGRIKAGKPALIRLDGFPWTQFGTLHAQVTDVGSEPRNGTIRVELEATSRSTGVTLSHGLTGTAEVEIERVRPLDLLFRSIGQFVGNGPSAGH